MTLSTEKPQVMTDASPSQWHALSKALHWLMALLIFVAILLGCLAVWWTTNDPAVKGTLYSLHKSTGLTVLALGIARVLWRFLQHRPAPLASHTTFEHRAAEIAHVVLYGLLLLLPLSGWLLHSAASVKFPLTWFGLFNVPDIAPNSELLQTIASWVHWSLFWVLGLLLIAHIGGAMKHHWLDRDVTVERMLPRHWLRSLLLYGMLILAVGAAGVAITLATLQALSSTEATVKPEISLDTAADDTDIINDSSMLASRWQLFDAEQQTPSQFIEFDFKVYGQDVTGQFNNVAVDLYFDPQQLAGSRVRTRVYVASADTQDASRDDMLPNSDWFWVEKHPTALFVAQQFRRDSGNRDTNNPERYLAEGELTIRGITQPLTIPFLWKQMGDQATLKAQVELNRLDYGIGSGDWASNDDVSHAVQVRFNLQLIRK